jgi:parallel beta-helix repeat protein
MSRRLVLACCVLGALSAWAPPAGATHVACGDTIMQDTTLDSDLVNCPGDGVVIGASGVTLDIAGHTIDGTRASGSAGVNNRAGHDGVTVTHGAVRDFGVSVDLRKQQGGEVNHLVTGNISLIDSSDIRIERNVAGSGIGVQNDSDRVLIARNEVDGTVILAGLPPHPLFGGGFPDDAVIDRNTIRTSLALFQAPNATVTRNRVLASPSDPIAAGIFIRGSQGSTLVDRNEVSGAPIGISLFLTRGTVTRNLVSENATDGIWAATNAFVLIDRNRSERNGDDGIDVDVTSLPPLFGTEPPTISRNLVSFNGDLGIEAVPDVTDGGGNKAKGNGDPAQCVNVTCK